MSRHARAVPVARSVHRASFAVLGAALQLVLARPAQAGPAPPAFEMLPWTPAVATPNDDFGRTVAPAGDVNRDGYGDILVAAPLDDLTPDGDEGRVYLFLGTATGIAPTPAWSWTPGLTNGAIEAVAPAGDVNGDGYADVAVGTPSWSVEGAPLSGKVSIFHGSASGLPANPSRDLFPPNAALFDRFGAAVSTAGDVNGDGYADLVVGSPDANRDGIGQCGVAYVFHGGPNGLAEVASFLYRGPDLNGRVGAAVSTAGDVNGDGFADVLVGAPQGRLNNVASGEVVLFLGSPLGVQALGAVTLNRLTLTGRYGTSVANAGDVDGDGYADILIGDPEFNDGFINGGRVELRRGAPGGLVATPLLVVESTDPAERLGQRVATLGDLDGDGYADFGFTAPGDGMTEPSGRLVVYRGRPGAPEFVGELAFAPADSGQFASSLATTGDVDGDGRAEFLVGSGIVSITPNGFGGLAQAYRLAPSQPRAFAGWPRNSGRFESFYGGSVAILPRLDISGSVYVAIGEPDYEDAAVGGRVQIHAATGAGINPDPSNTYTLPAPGQTFGERVADVGDVDGDGLSDFVVSAPRFQAVPGEEPRGRFVLYRGTSFGVPLAGTIYSGTQPGARLGASIAGRGDVNGDGYHDVLVAEPSWNGTAGPGCGRVSLYFGAPGGLNPLPWTLEGAGAYQGLGGGLELADLDADGYSDLILGSPATQNPNSIVGFVQVHYGGAAGPSPLAWTIQSSPPDPTFGRVIAAVGDQTGDGVCDFAVSAYFGDSPGEVSLFAGGRGRPRPAFPFWKRRETVAGSNFGVAIAGGGDVDGDGRADFVVGANGWSGSQDLGGRIQLFRGSGLGPVPAWTYEAERPLSQLGWAIAPLADVNGDGYADIIASAPGDTGHVYAFAGGGGPGRPRPLRIVGSDGVLGDPTRLHPARMQPGETPGYDITLRSAEGRARLAVQVEKVLQHEPFIGGPSEPGAMQFDTGAPSGSAGSSTTVLDNLELPWGGAAYRVRARTRSASPFFPHSPWLRAEAHESGDHDVWSDGVQVAVDPPAARPGGARLAGVMPNPFRGGEGATGGARIAYVLSRAGHVSLDVYDVRGARVRSLRDEMTPAGPGAATWDGRDDRGRRVRAGLYFVAFAAEGRTDRARLVLLR